MISFGYIQKRLSAISSWVFFILFLQLQGTRCAPACSSLLFSFLYCLSWELRQAKTRFFSFVETFQIKNKKHKILSSVSSSPILKPMGLNNITKEHLRNKPCYKHIAIKYTTQHQWQCCSFITMSVFLKKKSWMPSSSDRFPTSTKKKGKIETYICRLF